MAASNLLALLDDITTILDDVAILTKVAAKKTAGVLGDDLALNAQQVAGVHADRELPVVWAVAKGSIRNKAILVPAALLISALIPWAIIPLLMLGGTYLCFEGVEKLAHKFLHRKENEEHEAKLIKALSTPSIDLVALEQDKIKGAIRTDFILSAEIIVIALGTVANVPFTTQVVVLIGIALIMTAGVYGFVAAIVKLDDLGLYLSSQSKPIAVQLGKAILKAAPWLMKSLSVAGTAAMFLVGGGILTHGVSTLHHWIEHQSNLFATVPAIGSILGALTPALINALVGIAVGILALLAVNTLQRLRKSAHVLS